MKRLSIPLTLLLFSCLSADEIKIFDPPTCKKDEADCGQGYHPVRLGIRHIEANGIGYNQGYTTVEGFFTPGDPSTWF